MVRSVIGNLISNPEQAEGSNIVASQWTQILEGLNAGVTTFCDETREAAMNDMRSQLNRQQEHSFWTGPGSLLVSPKRWVAIHAVRRSARALSRCFAEYYTFYARTTRTTIRASWACCSQPALTALYRSDSGEESLLRLQPGSRCFIASRRCVRQEQRSHV